MKLFFAYIKQRRTGALAYLLFCMVFLITFILYRLPVKAVLYPAMICFLLGAVFIVWDFIRVRHRHGRLVQIKELTAAMMTSLPDPEGVEDADYQAIIGALRDETAELELRTTARYRDTVEYYTLWAHQIKTPIAAMRLTLQSEDTPLSRRLSADLFRIEQYVEMVLAFLRLDSPSNDYVFKEYSVDTVIKQAVARFSHEFIDRRLCLAYTPTDMRVVTDEKWLSFVVEQLLSNALKYTREGCVKIYARQNTLVIEDTGIGIAPEDLPRVFEKGYTGYNGRRDKKASGIGLYLCKRICKNLGAEIRVSSVLGEGTAVSIEFVTET